MDISPVDRLLTIYPLAKFQNALELIGGIMYGRERVENRDSKFR